MQELDDRVLREYAPPAPPADGDKEDRGAVLVVGGIGGDAGAVLLAGQAALRLGAGKLQIRADRGSAATLAAVLPEARILASPHTAIVGRLAGPACRSAAMVLGPGLEAGRQARRMACGLLEAAPATAAVIDAGALPDPSSAAVFARLCAGRGVLTPHAGEMAGLLDRTKAAIQDDPLQSAQEAAARYQAVVVMKGATTFVVTPDGAAWRHDGGVAGLGTSGSGDVLAGAIGGLLARGSSPLGAALWGVAVHARAGRALARATPLGFIASDLLRRLPVELSALDNV